MRRLFMIGIICLAATPASAYGLRPSSLFPDNQLQDIADYLVCLHNEQVDQINALQDTVSAQANDLEKLRSTVSDLEERVEALEDNR